MRSPVCEVGAIFSNQVRLAASHVIASLERLRRPNAAEANEPLGGAFVLHLACHCKQPLPTGFGPVQSKATLMRTRRWHLHVIVGWRFGRGKLLVTAGCDKDPRSGVDGDQVGAGDAKQRQSAGLLDAYRRRKFFQQRTRKDANGAAGRSDVSASPTTSRPSSSGNLRPVTASIVSTKLE